MGFSPSTQPSEKDLSSKMQIDYESLQRSTVLLSLVGLLISVLILGTVGSQTAEYIWPLTTALLIAALIPLVWLISRRSFTLAAVVLALGCLGSLLMVF